MLVKILEYGEDNMIKKPKKLKKIPYDLVSYIQIETEAMQDINDKHMLSSYCLGKLKMVEWYIQLLEVGSEKYIVPHSLSELKEIQQQLKDCHKAIMSTKVPNSVQKNERPLIDIKYPKGYEG
jgi:hypothetical protein